MNILKFPGSVVLAVVVPGMVYAGTGNHGAHVHGIAEITLALEGNHLEIMFTSPAMDVLGFEHKATSEEHLAAVTEAEQRLEDVSAWISFKGTQCDLQDSQIDVTAVLESDSPEPSSHDHHEDHGHEEHGHEEHDEHQHHGEDEKHSDVSAHYHYSCADGGKLEAVQLGVGEMPFGLEKINAMWVTERAQGSVVLTENQREVELR